LVDAVVERDTGIEMTLSYHKEADVLYVTFETLPPDAYVFVENESGDVLKIDKKTRRVVGCTIPFFARRAKLGKVVVPEIGAVPFNDIADTLLSA
jgi:hypothetical protein